MKLIEITENSRVAYYVFPPRYEEKNDGAAAYTSLLRTSRACRQRFRFEVIPRRHRWTREFLGRAARAFGNCLPIVASFSGDARDQNLRIV